MNVCKLFLAWVVVAALSVPATATGQMNRAILDVQCQSSGVLLIADFDIVSELPSEWVGWVIERTTNGVCESRIRIGNPAAFPEGQATIQIVDELAVDGLGYRYHIRAVDTDGILRYLGSSFSWPGYYQIAYSSCGLAPVARGQLTDLGWTTGIEPCDQGCWFYLAFISELPAALQQYVGTSTEVLLFGEIEDEFEGAYVNQIYSWFVLEDCAVPTDTGSWGVLKSRYR
jgi:hypothetical protein